MEKSADALLATQWWQATDADLLTALREIEELTRRVYATTLAIQAQAQQRGLTGGYDSTRGAIADAARVSQRSHPPRSPHRADRAFAGHPHRRAEGAIGADHLDVIAKTLAQIPAHVTPNNANSPSRC